MIILDNVSNRLDDFLHLFQWFFQSSGMVSSIFSPDLQSTRLDDFSSRFEDFLHFSSEWFSSLLEWFLLFFNLLMKNEKEILIKCIYLITLTLQDFSDSFWRFHLFLAFLLLNVIFVLKQITNFNECDVQGGFALTVYLS